MDGGIIPGFAVLINSLRPLCDSSYKKKIYSMMNFLTVVPLSPAILRK